MINRLTALLLIIIKKVVYSTCKQPKYLSDLCIKVCRCINGRHVQFYHLIWIFGDKPGVRGTDRDVLACRRKLVLLVLSSSADLIRVAPLRMLFSWQFALFVLQNQKKWKENQGPHILRNSAGFECVQEMWLIDTWNLSYSTSFFLLCVYNLKLPSAPSALDALNLL